MIRKLLIFFLLLFLFFPLNAGESINKIIATVGNVSITQLDYLKMQEKYNKLAKYISKDKQKRKKNGYSKKSKIIDMLITRTIVNITAEEETIQVNEKRIESEIEKRMQMMNIDNLEDFKKTIEAQSGIPFKMWKSELPFQIKKGQLMQIRVTTKMPTEQDIRKWYNKNKAQIGIELKYREIAIVPQNSTIKEEKRIFHEISQIEKELKKNPSAFSLIASGPRNKSNLRGGLRTFTPVFEIYQNSKIITAILSRLRKGGISEIFRDEQKRYVILRLEGKRFTPLEQVRGGIQNILMRQKEEEAFSDWIAERKKEIPIAIYDRKYLAEHKMKPPDETFNYSKINP